MAPGTINHTVNSRNAPSDLAEGLWMSSMAARVTACSMEHDRVLPVRTIGLACGAISVGTAPKPAISFFSGHEPAMKKHSTTSTASVPIRSEEHTSELQSRENLVC